MGRHRLPENEKKVDIKIKVKKKYYDELKERKINVSQLVDEFLQNYLKK